VATSLALAACVAAAAQCAPPVIVTSDPTPARAPADSARAPSSLPAAVPPATPPPASAPPRVAAAWPVRVLQHVDLWLHGFAMLQDDSTLIPYFQRGYRARLLEARSRKGLTTLLDANADTLRARLTANPGLIAAQFVPLYFPSEHEMRQGAEAFLRLDGDARNARDPRSRDAVATFSAYFPTPADRDFLRLFLAALEDERAKFYEAYWRDTQRERGAAFDAVERLWRDQYAARFERFLTFSQQRNGEVLLSLPLAGEGRTLTAPGRRMTVAVGFPADSASAVEMVHVYAHEVVGTVANAVVTDNTSPVERRSGAADRYSSLAAVRGGAMLLARAAPDLTEGYMGYYLRLAGRSVPRSAGDLEREFAATFPLPDPLRDALRRQIDIILGGI
jgi:hypothetical protein